MLLHWRGWGGQSLHAVSFLHHLSHYVLSPDGKKEWVPHVGPGPGKLIAIFRGTSWATSCVVFGCLLVKFCFIVCAFKNLLACHSWQSRIAAGSLLPLSGRCQKVRAVSSCVSAFTALTHPFHSGLLLLCGNLSCLLVSRESSRAFLYAELLLGVQDECWLPKRSCCIQITGTVEDLFGCWLVPIPLKKGEEGVGSCLCGRWWQTGELSILQSLQNAARLSVCNWCPFLSCSFYILISISRSVILMIIHQKLKAYSHGNLLPPSGYHDISK